MQVRFLHSVVLNDLKNILDMKSQLFVSFEARESSELKGVLCEKRRCIDSIKSQIEGTTWCWPPRPLLPNCVKKMSVVQICT